MATNVDQCTAGACARQLLDALNSGSHTRVRRALDGIASLASSASEDARELEFRDLLAGIAEPIAHGTPSKAAAVRLLTHVAGAYAIN